MPHCTLDCAVSRNNVVAPGQRNPGVHETEADAAGGLFGMTGKILLSVLALALAGATVPVQAQESSTNRVEAETDWSVFVEPDPKRCWAVSTFKESVNTRDGRVVAVRRGEILLFVSYMPGLGVDGQVSFTGGYPFAPGSQVTVEVGSDKFVLNTDKATNPEMAWSPSSENDAKMIAAMKRGSEAVVSARSARGTTTKDTFSLLGFTAAADEAKKRCAG